MTVSIQVQTEPLDIASLLQQASLSEHDFGAQATFTGWVRQHDHATPITHLHLEHYPEVTEAEIARIVKTCLDKWPVSDVVVVHRVGKIAVGEPIVFVLTQAGHRGAAYAANEYLMDYLKTTAPFWKQECFADGSADWVAAKRSDVAKQHRWSEA